MKRIYFSLFLALAFLSACNYEDLLPIGPQEEGRRVTISTESELLTMINILKPDSTEQSEVVTLLGQGMDSTASQQNGFVSASIHRSLDNHYVVNYAQWRRLENVQAVVELVQNGEAPELAEAFAKGNPEFHPYAVTAQFASDDRTVAVNRQNSLLTAINLLVPNEGVTQAEVAELLKIAMDEEIRYRPGFVSASVHESLDNDYVVNYAQWKDQASLDATVEAVTNGELPKLGQVFSVANADFHGYAVAGTYFKK